MPESLKPEDVDKTTLITKKTLEILKSSIKRTNEKISSPPGSPRYSQELNDLISKEIEDLCEIADQNLDTSKQTTILRTMLLAKQNQLLQENNDILKEHNAFIHCLQENQQSELNKINVQVASNDSHLANTSFYLKLLGAGTILLGIVNTVVTHYFADDNCDCSG